MKRGMNLLAVLLTSVAMSSDAIAQSTAIVGGTVIDGNGGMPIKEGVILIEGKRIVAVGSKSMAIPPQAKKIAAAGKYVIPGLMDANVHLVEYNDPLVLVRYEGRYDMLAVEAAQVTLRNGVTTVFDSWGPREYLLKARDAINAGRVVGSRIYLAGNIIGLGGPLSEDFDLSFPRAREVLSEEFADRIDAIWQENVGPELVSMSPEQVREEIRKYVRKGIDFVKYAVTTHRLRPESPILFSPRVQQVIVEEAHRAGLTVQTHTMSGEAIHLAVEAGVDLLQHCDYSLEHSIPAETVTLIAQRRIPCVFVPTTAEGWSNFRRNAQMQTLPFRFEPFEIDVLLKRFEIADLNERALLRAGALVLLSTDWGDEGFFDALLAVEQKGMKPMDALMAATRNIARAYKVDKDLGTLEKGKIADLLILDRNPLESAANYRSISLVMKEGTIIDRNALPTGRVSTARTAWRAGDPPRLTTASLRGLSVARNGVVWASGAKGTVLRSTDSGATWELRSIPDAASFDLRDVEAVSASTAYAMVTAADTARIYKTTDGGRTWARQYDDTRRGVFLDGLAFWDERRGIALGDQMAGRLLVLRTEDGGARWVELPPTAAPKARPGEGGFAASGTTVVVGAGGRAWIGTGAISDSGAFARVFRSTDYGRTWTVSETPIPSGSSSTGIFSLAFRDSLHGVAVGGDYANPRASRANVAFTTDGGRTWQLGDSAGVTAYLSGVAYVTTAAGQALVGVGTAGTFRSADDGRTWERLNSSSYNAVAAPVRSSWSVAVGAKGRVAVWRALDDATQDMAE